MSYLLILSLFSFDIKFEPRVCEAKFLTTLQNDIQNISSTIGHQGVRIVSYSDSEVKCSFLIGVASTSASQGKSESMLSRITAVKLKREVLIFIQGSTVTSETIFKTEQEVNNDEVSYYESIIDKISENSAGFVDGMKSLKSFRSDNGNLFVNTQYNLIQE